MLGVITLSPIPFHFHETCLPFSFKTFGSHQIKALLNNRKVFTCKSSDTVCLLRYLSNKVAANVLLESQFSNACCNGHMVLRTGLCKRITISETIKSWLSGKTILSHISDIARGQSRGSHVSPFQKIRFVTTIQLEQDLNEQGSWRQAIKQLLPLNNCFIYTF